VGILSKARKRKNPENRTNSFGLQLPVHDLPIFIAAGLLLAMSPGPDTAYILGRSAQHGRRGGFVAALGIAAGIWVHILAAAVGLSALLMASARAFMFAKLIGAAYLLFLGLKLIVSSGPRRKLAMGSTTTPTAFNQTRAPDAG